MSLLLMDGFDYYTSADARWSYSGANLDLSMVGGRFGAQGLQMHTNGTGGQALVRALPSTATTLIFGAALVLDSEAYFGCRTAAGVLVGYVVVSGGVLVAKNAAGTTVGTGTTPITGTWHYVEIKVVVNGASGSIEVHVDGAVEIASVVSNFGTTAIGQIILGFSAGPATEEIDDVYACDNAGTINNDFLGDVRIEALRPNADGAHTQWTPDSGTAHYSRLNETTPDGDTSYVRDATVGDRDSYAFTDLTDLAGSVFGVQTHLYARKDNSALKQICAVARPGTTDHDGAAVTLASSYGFFDEFRETNPDTSAPWTISEVNAAEFGVKVVA